MTSIYIQLSFEIIGNDADQVANAMRESIADGKIDLPVMQVLEDEFDSIPGDWRIVNMDSALTEEGVKVTA